MAGLAGVVQSARVGSANPSILQTLLLPAFTAAFLGATSIRPGQYNIWGTVLAVYLVGLGTTGLFMPGAFSDTEPVFDDAGPPRRDRPRQAQRAPPGAFVTALSNRSLSL